MGTALSLVLMAPTVSARRARVARSFDMFADGPTLGDDIHGNHPVRAAVGKTVSVSRLSQGTTYGSQVRNQACADGNARGHSRS